MFAMASSSRRHHSHHGGGFAVLSRWRVVAIMIVVVLVFQQLSTQIPSLPSPLETDSYAATIAISENNNKNIKNSTRRHNDAHDYATNLPPNNKTLASITTTTNPKQEPTFMNHSSSSSNNNGPSNSVANNDHVARPNEILQQHVLWKYRNNDIANNNQNLAKITIMLWPLWDATIQNQPKSSDVLHIEQDGIQESAVMELAQEPPLAPSSLANPNMVWMTDAKYNSKNWCERLAKKIQQAQAKRAEWNSQKNATTNKTVLLLPLQWPVFVVDFTDLTRYEKCTRIEDAMGKEFVFYSKRSIVINRHWNKTKEWVELGERLPQVTKEGREYRHTPLVARTDTIEIIQGILKDRGNNSNNTTTISLITLADPIEELLDRPVDLSHFWASDANNNNKKKINPVASHLRDYMNTIITRHFLNDTNIFVGLVGTPDMVGRRVAQVGFIQAMLDSKIIVVTQRDKWEDQYRLYEALLAGAMVMTDTMIALPYGLQNGTSIIEFGSAQEFVSLARYYLQHANERIAIAKEGRRVVMSFHRSWHRMEEIVLGGNVLTTCNANTHPNCPFVVHVNDAQ